MIVDSSALLAILLEEPDAASFAAHLAQPGRKRLSAASYLECAIRFDNLVEPPSVELDALLADFQIEIVPVTLEQVRAARIAHRRFGRGRHPAALNFGDCFVYALAAAAGERVLCKGQDFRRTDLSTVQ